MDEHRHHWSVVDFYVERERPMMRQACACGAMRAIRAIRAWDRSWDPAVGEAKEEPIDAGTIGAAPQR